VRLVETLVVRDEADIVDAQIAYHLNAGVDFVIASDHESRDGTTEILEAYARRGYLRRIPVSGEVRESEWRTTMARLAATDHGAEWVINTDADEFWMPRDGTLQDAFRAVPAAYGVVWALTRHFVPRPEVEPFFADRMTARVSALAPLNDPTSPYRPHAKAAHRADPEIRVRHGAHLVHSSMQPLHHWHLADVLHFPFRSLAQYERKGVRRAHGDSRLGQYVKAYHASEGGRIQDTYASLELSDERVERGVSCGSLVLDVRLRDALRGLRVAEPPAPEISPGGTFTIGRSELPRVSRSAEHRGRDHAEAAALRDADLVRVARQLDGLELRLRAVEGDEGAGRARAVSPALAHDAGPA
jgi:Glycosyl transferase family 2